MSSVMHAHPCIIGNVKCFDKQSNANQRLYFLYYERDFFKRYITKRNTLSISFYFFCESSSKKFSVNTMPANSLCL